MGALMKEICDDSMKFYMTIVIIFTLLMWLILMGVLVIIGLCISDRRRRKRYTKKYQSYNNQRNENIEQLNRVLTYLGYVNKVGYLSKEDSKHPDCVALLTDPNMIAQRKISASVVDTFFNGNESSPKSSLTSTKKSKQSQ